MSIRKIEVPIFAKEAVDDLLDSARSLANRLDARIEVRFIRPVASDAAVYDAGFGYASASLIDQIEQEGAAAALAAHRNFLAWCGRHPVLPPIDWVVEEGHVGAVVAQRGCLADLILLRRSAAKQGAIDESFEAAVYGAGRLAMVVDAHLSPEFLDHVMIAWNESTEASRAIAQSMPFLVKAGRVSIFTAPEGGAEPAQSGDLIDYLALHGVSAVPVAEHPRNGAVGDALLKTAHAENASLLVMGAYTHGRVRQMLFGGVTQHVLTTAGLPVLMAH